MPSFEKPSLRKKIGKKCVISGAVFLVLYPQILMKSTEDILVEFTAATLQVKLLDKEIAKLEALRRIAEGKANEAFDLYHDRLKQSGKEIEMPNITKDIMDSINKPT